MISMGAVYKVLNFNIQAYYDCYHYKKGQLGFTL